MIRDRFLVASPLPGEDEANIDGPSSPDQQPIPDLEETA